MATVYLAEDLKHQRKVAVKVLQPELAAVIGAERFLSEIKTTANLQHPHILPLFDSGSADGLLNCPCDPRAPVSVSGRSVDCPLLLRLLVACGVALVPAQHVAAQSSPADAPLPMMAGTWYLVTKHPRYDSTIVSPSPPARSQAPTGPAPLVRMDLVRFASEPLSVPPQTSARYPHWVEQNPRDSLLIIVEENITTILGDGAPALQWETDGLIREDRGGEELFLVRAFWKKGELFLERARPNLATVQRRFRLLKDGRLELSWPGSRRNPAFPTKYIFSRERPASKP